MKDQQQPPGYTEKPGEKEDVGLVSLSVLKPSAFQPPGASQAISLRRPLVLFLLTILSTLLAGAVWKGVNPFSSVNNFFSGWTFSVALMSILLAHEMGHYFMSRYHGVPVSLPYFIPFPPIPIFTPAGVLFYPTLGTFGAIIRMQTIVRHRRILFDIGIAGPVAGMCVAVPATIVGLFHSNLIEVSTQAGGLELGDSLLFMILIKLIFGAVPGTQTVLLHPVAFAGWLGFFLTSLNLLPMGQLDGGHVTYGIFGARHRIISRGVFLCLLLWGVHGAFAIFKPVAWLWALAFLGVGFSMVLDRRLGRPWHYLIPMLILFIIGAIGSYSPDTMIWLFWACLITFLRLDHPPTRDVSIPLDRNRQVLGWIGLLLFALTFIPAPFKMHMP